jgi:SAM-dependent methyltransferase
MSPLANAFLTPEQCRQMEPFYPLHAFVCERCLLVQLEQFESCAQFFGLYAYFSSYSVSWLEHARRYAEMAVERFGLGPHSQVVEVASNDGYLLQYFVERGIPALGVEPAANTARAAIARGVPTLVAFFGRAAAGQLLQGGTHADLLIGNNVLAHVPDLNDFVASLKLLLAPHGVLTLEFPHLLRLIDESQFDTIYHEHFSYFSFLTAQRILAHHGLTIFDVQELATHGGSLRIYARHSEDAGRTIGPRVAALADREIEAGFGRIERYLGFAEQVMEVKRQLLLFLIEARRNGKRVAGYGAPAKGNTLLNYCGVRADLLEYTVDRSPHKQGRALPGTHIPIYAPQYIAETRPDYVLILPWNLRDEIMAQLAYIREWGARFVVPIPRLQVLE